MFRTARFVWPLLALAAVASSPGTGPAGWVSIKNDTQSAVVVQDVPSVVRPLRRPKAVRLLPGEVYREFHPTPGEKTVHIFDPKSPGKPLCVGKLAWQAADLTLRVEAADQVVRLAPAPLRPPAAPPVVAVGGAPPVPAPPPVPPKR